MARNTRLRILLRACPGFVGAKSRRTKDCFPSSLAAGGGGRRISATQRGRPCPLEAFTEVDFRVPSGRANELVAVQHVLGNIELSRRQHVESDLAPGWRSEARRVGKECRSGWS